MDRVFVTFAADTPVPEAVMVLGRKRLFGACVVDGTGKVLGILSERECLKVYKRAVMEKTTKPVDESTVSDIMYLEFKTIPSSTGIVQAAQIFLEQQFRRMPVVDDGKLVGQITRRDMVKAIQKFGL